MHEELSANQLCSSEGAHTYTVPSLLIGIGYIGRKAVHLGSEGARRIQGVIHAYRTNSTVRAIKP
jgi:hypothetical protein